MIAQVEPGSPADRAGLGQGDVVVAVDGAAVHSSTELRNRIGLIEADRSVALDIVRGGRRSRVMVRRRAQGARQADAADQVAQFAGAALADIPSDHPAYGQVDGVLVTGVARTARRRGPACAGDIILGVDGQAVTSLAELRARLPRPGRPSRSILRGDAELLITVR